MKDKIVKLIATFFYVGCLPLMPGTWGSLAGAIIYYLVRFRFNNCLPFFTFALLFFLGLITAGRAEELLGKKDDKRIVIDEVTGMLLVFILIQPTKLSLIVGFILFRIFDILKLYPANKLEKLPGSLGIMADDILLALYSYIFFVVLSLALRLF